MVVPHKKGREVERPPFSFAPDPREAWTKKNVRKDILGRGLKQHRPILGMGQL